MSSPYLAPPVAGSIRVPLARLALKAASRVPGVLGTDPGPHQLRVTADPPGGLLTGVSVTAQADGRYTVDLCLVAGMTPLLALAEDVRARVRSDARRERLEDELGTVNVEFARVMSADEALVESVIATEEAVAALSGTAPAGSTQALDPALDPGLDTREEQEL